MEEDDGTMYECVAIFCDEHNEKMFPTKKSGPVVGLEWASMCFDHFKKTTGLKELILLNALTKEVVQRYKPPQSVAGKLWENLAQNTSLTKQLMDSKIFSDIGGTLKYPTDILKLDNVSFEDEMKMFDPKVHNSRCLVCKIEESDSVFVPGLKERLPKSWKMYTLAKVYDFVAKFRLFKNAISVSVLEINQATFEHTTLARKRDIDSGVWTDFHYTPIPLNEPYNERFVIVTYHEDSVVGESIELLYLSVEDPQSRQIIKDEANKLFFKK